jgi:hypothetical protein
LCTSPAAKHSETNNLRREIKPVWSPPGRDFCAERMHATTYDINSSHVPMLSHPDYVINVIRAAAAGV